MRPHPHFLRTSKMNEKLQAIFDRYVNGEYADTELAGVKRAIEAAYEAGWADADDSAHIPVRTADPSPKGPIHPSCY